MAFTSRSMWAISPATPISRNSSFDLALPGLEQAQHRSKGRLVDLADLIGQTIGELGGAGAQARCVDGDRRMRDGGKAHHLFGVVADDVGVGDDELAGV